jgi:aryl-alcohol dehydrogenase-like predicted oxidoreductase
MLTVDRSFARFARTGKRKDIFLATKFGVYNQGGRHVNGSPEYMHQQFEKSLKRFQTGMSFQSWKHVGY